MGLTFDDIKEEFVQKVAADKTCFKYKKLAEAGKATYADVSQYGARVGTLLGRVLKKHAPLIDISEWDLDNLIPQALGLDHRMVSAVCMQVQETLNKEAGIGIRPVEPKFDGNRAYGIVKELRANPEFTNIEATFYDQLANFSQNVVDEAIRDNAALQTRAGLHAYITRIAEPGACPWCVALEGTYDYADVKDTGNNVWRRHENCRCIIEYHVER